MIRLLSEYRKMRVHDITVVFDGWKSGGPREETLKTGSITVIYSRLGENADYVIKRIISRDKREWIVVTSDRDIAAFAWALALALLIALASAVTPLYRLRRMDVAAVMAGR